jgi:hypothetical protein
MAGRDTLTVPVDTESELQQFDVFVRSFEIFKERSVVRGDLWAKFEAKDAFRNMESKMARIGHAGKELEEIGFDSDEKLKPIEEALVDDALDVINYAAFLIRHIEGNKPDV